MERPEGAALVALDQAMVDAGDALVRAHLALSLAQPALDEPPATPLRLFAEDLLALMVALRSTVALYAREACHEL